MGDSLDQHTSRKASSTELQSHLQRREDAVRQLRAVSLAALGPGERAHLPCDPCQILPLPISATDLNSKATWFGIQ
jgi:hypothetical protein